MMKFYPLCASFFILVALGKIDANPAPENDVHFHINMAETDASKRSMIPTQPETKESGTDYSEQGNFDVRKICKQSQEFAKEWTSGSCRTFEVTYKKDRKDKNP